MKQQLIGQIETKTDVPKNEYFEAFKTPEAFALLALGTFYLGYNLFKRDTGGKLAKGHFAGRKEKARARRLAIEQIEAGKHNSVSGYLGRPKSSKSWFYDSGKNIFIPDLQRGTAVIGGAGSGKTDSAILPLIYSSIDQHLPCLVWDFKYPTLTSRFVGHAAKNGYRINIFAPGYPESGICNPLDFLKNEEDGLMAGQFAEVLVRNLEKGKNTQEDKFFGSAGILLTKAIVMLAKSMDLPDILTCQILLSLPSLAERVKSNASNLNPWIYRNFGQLVSVIDSERTVASIIATANSNFTAFLDSDILSAFCGKTTIPLRIEKKELLVVGLDREKRDVIAPLIATVIDLIVSHNISDRSHPLMLFFDEVPPLFLPRLANWLNEGREDGLCTTIGLQNFTQFVHSYGENLARIILGGCANKLIFNPQDPTSAEHFSKMFQEKEIKDKQKSRSTGKNPSTTMSEQKRTKPLISAADLQSYPMGKCVISGPGYGSKKEAFVPLVTQIKLSSQYKKTKKQSEQSWNQIRKKLTEANRKPKITEQALQLRSKLVELKLPSEPAQQQAHSASFLTNQWENYFTQVLYSKSNLFSEQYDFVQANRKQAPFEQNFMDIVEEPVFTEHKLAAIQLLSQKPDSQ